MSDPNTQSDHASETTGGAVKGVTRGRRMTFGVSAVVMAASVIVIVVFANWIAARHADALRFDWTAMGRYSLSPQTQRVIAGLDEPIHITTLFAEGVTTDDRTRRRIRRFRDLLDEYDRRSGGKVTVKHVSAGDAERERRLYEQVAARFEQDLADGRAAIEDALAAIEGIPAFAEDLVARIDAQQQRLDADDASTIDTLRQFRGVYRSFAEDPQTAEGIAQVRRQLAEPLPPYRELLDAVRETLRNFRSSNLAPTLDALRRIAEDDSRSPRARDAAGRLLPVVQAMLDRVNAQLQAMDGLDFTAYRTAVRTIQRTDSATILGPEDVVVLNLDDLYLRTAAADEQGQADDRARFRGEEAVTGAILSLTRADPPHVVFADPGADPATGARGMFAHVTERLATMNVRISEYNPLQPQGRMPEPTEGERLVWVILPPPPPDRNDPRGTVQRAQAMRRFVEDLADQRADFVVLLRQNPMARFGQRNPLTPLLERFGIAAAEDQLILRHVFLPDGRQMPTTQLDLTRWPDDNPLSRALRGLRVTFANAVPLELTADEAAGVDPFTILATDESVWAERNMVDRTALPEPNENERRGPIPVAAGGEVEGRRLVAFGSMRFAMDPFVLARRSVPTAEGMREVTSVQRPGNVELMVNSIYWAAGMDDLIATGARSQAVARWDQLEPDRYRLIMWLLIAGLPLAALLAGVGMWTLRRR